MYVQLWFRGIIYRKRYVKYIVQQMRNDTAVYIQSWLLFHQTFLFLSFTIWRLNKLILLRIAKICSSGLFYNSGINIIHSHCFRPTNYAIYK